jgi:hypothetical protein
MTFTDTDLPPYQVCDTNPEHAERAWVAGCWTCGATTHPETVPTVAPAPRFSIEDYL